MAGGNAKAQMPPSQRRPSYKSRRLGIVILLILSTPHVLLHASLQLALAVLYLTPPDRIFAATTPSTSSTSSSSSSSPCWHSLDFCPLHEDFARTETRFLPDASVPYFPSSTLKIVNAIWTHLRYSKVTSFLSFSSISLQFQDLEIMDLTLTPFLKAPQLTLTLSVPTLPFLLKTTLLPMKFIHKGLHNFLSSPVKISYGVLDVSLPHCTVNIKTGAVKPHAYPLAVAEGRSLSTVKYPTNLHPFVRNLPPFPTEVRACCESLKISTPNADTSVRNVAAAYTTVLFARRRSTAGSRLE